MLGTSLADVEKRPSGCIAVEKILNFKGSYSNVVVQFQDTKMSDRNAKLEELMARKPQEW